MKKIRNWIPVARYDIASMEAWLEEMARSGLLAVQFWGPFAYFEAGTPRPKRRYRLDVNIKLDNVPAPSLRALYEQAGWTFAGNLWGAAFFVFFSDDPSALEPYTDPQSRALSLNGLVKNLRAETLLIFFTAFSATALLFYRIAAFISLPYCYPLTTAAPAFLWLLNFFFAYRSFRAIRRMKQRLEAGQAAEPRKPHFPSGKASGACRSPWPFLAVLILAVVLESCVLPKLLQRTTPLEDADPDLSILDLADLEGAGYQPDPHEMEELVLDLHRSPPQYSMSLVQKNYLETGWLPLAPRYCSIHQSGTKDGVSASLTIDRYDLIASNLARPTLDSLSQYDDVTELSIPGADCFWIADGGNTVYASRGNRVLLLQYCGTADLSAYYGAIAALLAAPR